MGLVAADQGQPPLSCLASRKNETGARHSIKRHTTSLLPGAPEKLAMAKSQRNKAGHLLVAWCPAKTRLGHDAAAQSRPPLIGLASRNNETGQRRSGTRPAISQLLGVPEKLVRAVLQRQKAGHLSTAWRPAKKRPGRDTAAKGLPSLICSAPRQNEIGPSRSGTRPAVSQVLGVPQKRNWAETQRQRPTMSQLLSV